MRQVYHTSWTFSRFDMIFFGYNDCMKQNRAAMDVQVLVKGVLAVFYFNKLIALVDQTGLIVWRDLNYPIFLVEYLIEMPDHQDRWN